MDVTIAQAGNTVVPAVLALEALGYELGADAERVFARKGHERYVADDPVSVLGLVKLVELRAWSWMASDTEIDTVFQRYPWL